AAVAGDEEALAEVARDVGADTALVDRVRANIRLTSSFVFSHISGAVGLIKASKTARGDVASDLGWGKVFSRVISREFPADHMTILGNDPPALAAAIKILWAETGDWRVDDE
ncbi:MAG: hypothetical protein O3B74_12695, partial [Proteobacteria bacterium]|nr:hypothetical protein [Pseudomonadota bacterium]